MDLSAESAERTFKVFVASSKPDHFLLYFPQIGHLVEDTKGCFYTRFMEVILDEGYELTKGCAPLIEQGICYFISRKLRSHLELSRIESISESLYAAGVLDTNECVSWSDGDDLIPLQALIYSNYNNARNAPIALPFNLVSMHDDCFRIERYFFEKPETLDNSLDDTRQKVICNDLVSHTHCSKIPWYHKEEFDATASLIHCIERVNQSTERLKELGDLLGLADSDKETVLDKTVTPTKSEEIVQKGDKARKRKKNNSARKEKKRQYHKNLKAQKKVGAKESRHATSGRYDATTESDCVFDELDSEDRSSEEEIETEASEERESHTSEQSWIEFLFWKSVQILNYAPRTSMEMLLITFGPLSLVLRAIPGVNALIIFVVNFIAVIPLAALLSFATEELFMRLVDVLGGLLNASFRNAVELIIALIVVVENEITIMQILLILALMHLAPIDWSEQRIRNLGFSVWVVATVLTPFGVQLCATWKGLPVIEILVSFWFGIFAFGVHCGLGHRLGHFYEPLEVENIMLQSTRRLSIPREAGRATHQ